MSTISTKVFSTTLTLFGLISSLIGQDSHGGEIFTKESYQYGRFEVKMQSADGDGIVSSFFLYNVEAGNTCTWPETNNEIDIEMTGNDQQIYFTTHHPDPVQPWYYGDDFYVGFNPHQSFLEYAIEWEPGIVKWFVNDRLIYWQDDDSTDNLKYPMAIMMNLWASDAVPWVGVWNPSVMPRQVLYDYVRYYKYTPGQGHTGTNNNFTLSWEDNFNSLDTSRWEISDFKRFEPLTVLRETNVEVKSGYLTITLEKPQTSTELIPVTFSVNMENRNLLPSDKVYLNGTFNTWCGTCNPMTRDGDVWSLTLDLPPEKYEYLFTING